MPRTQPTTLKPKLRFPAFRDSEAWIDGRCDDLAEVLQGYGFPDRHQGESDGEYPFYKVSDISNAVARDEKYIVSANNYINDDVLSEIGAKPVPTGTTIFAKIGEAIRSNRRVITSKPSVVDNNVAGIKALPSKSTDEFLYYLWSNIPLIDFAGGVVPAISKTAIATIPISYTNIEAEQRAIADCLGSVDDWLAAAGRKLAALRDHKRGLMQQLFPQPGQSQPQQRFPEFRKAEKWERSKLGTVCELYQPETLSTADLDKDGRYLVYGANGVIGRLDHYNHENSEVVVTCRGATCGEVSRTKPRSWITGNAMVVRPRSERLLSDYLFYWLKADGLMSVISGSAQPQITRTGFAPLQITYPKDSEQQKIAACLTALDTQITAQAAQIESLKTHKHGLMQQLFPSPEAAR